MLPLYQHASETLTNIDHDTVTSNIYQTTLYKITSGITHEHYYDIEMCDR